MINTLGDQVSTIGLEINPDETSAELHVLVQQTEVGEGGFQVTDSTQGKNKARVTPVRNSKVFAWS